MNILNQIPTPPVDMVMPLLGQAIFTYGQIVPILVFIYIAFRHWKKTGEPIAFYFMIAGATASLIEPVFDHLTGVWFPVHGNWVLFHSIDREIPWYLTLAYFWYWGGQALFVYMQMEKGVTKKQVWKYYWIIALMDPAVEVPGLLLGTYTYYGTQAFQIFGLPLWWCVVNPLAVITFAAVVYKIKPLLPGWKLSFMIILFPMVDAMTNFALNWPMIHALNSNSSVWVTRAASIFVLGLGLFWCWMITNIVAKDSTAKFGGYRET